MHTQIRPMLDGDWEAVREIYQKGIDSGNSTFEIEVPSWEAWDQAHLRSPRLVLACVGSDPAQSKVIGWAALSPYSRRAVYAGVASISIYLDPASQGHGLGETLLAELIEQSEMAGIWTLQAGIFPENTPSVRLHQKLGFRLVGLREKIGKMNGVWRDSLLLERRTTKI